MEQFSNIGSEIKPGSNKSFGAVFSLFFFVVGIWPLVKGGEIRIFLLFIAAVFLVLTVFVPSVFTIPNRLWFKLGMLLGSIVSPIVMAILYICAIIPFSIIFRLKGRDALDRKFDSNAETYWITRTKKPQSMKNQF